LRPAASPSTVVAPAAAETPMRGDPARAATPPNGRFVRADEVAALTSFLLSAEAGLSPASKS